jgi:hypothetical protein
LVLRIVGKGTKLALIPLVPCTARTIDLAIAERQEGPILVRQDGALMEATLEGGMAAGHLRPQPVRPLAVVMIAAFDEAALYVARAEDPESARAKMITALGHLVGGLVVHRGTTLM